jgi:hypothetical protein
MEQELELTKAAARDLQEELDMRNNELLMLRKQLEVAKAVANESDEVTAESRQETGGEGGRTATIAN